MASGYGSYHGGARSVKDPCRGAWRGRPAAADRRPRTGPLGLALRRPAAGGAVADDRVRRAGHRPLAAHRRLLFDARLRGGRGRDPRGQARARRRPLHGRRRRAHARTRAPGARALPRPRGHRSRRPGPRAEATRGARRLRRGARTPVRRVRPRHAPLRLRPRLDGAQPAADGGDRRRAPREAGRLRHHRRPRRRLLSLLRGRGRGRAHPGSGARRPRRRGPDRPRRERPRPSRAPAERRVRRAPRGRPQPAARGPRDLQPPRVRLPPLGGSTRRSAGEPTGSTSSPSAFDAAEGDVAAPEWSLTGWTASRTKSGTLMLATYYAAERRPAAATWALCASIGQMIRPWLTCLRRDPPPRPRPPRSLSQ